MKAKVIFALMVVAVLAGGIGWRLGRVAKDAPPQDSNAPKGERKIAYYQSSMHPWIKSEKPGVCTICGMKLTPIFEGDKGFETEGGIVTLSSNAIQVVNVQTEPVKHRQIGRTLNVAGKIEADETRVRVLSSYLDGRVEKLFVNYIGAEVRAGEPLAVVYSPALLTAEREYLTALAQTNLSGSPRLTEEHLRLVEGARQRLKRLGLSDDGIEALRDKGATNFATQIVAPMSGTIVSRAVFEGQYVKEGDKLFEIADLSKLWFRFDVYEQDLPSIHKGEMVEVRSAALAANRFSGPIAFIDPNINDAARSARVRVELENPLVGEGASARRALYNGLFAEGSIPVNSGMALAVPRSAVLDPGDFPRVYVDQGAGAYELRRVKIGRRGAEYWEVLEGVEENESVVTSGNLLIDSQAQINQSTHSSHNHEGAGHTNELAHPAETPDAKKSETERVP